MAEDDEQYATGADAAAGDGERPRAGAAAKRGRIEIRLQLSLHRILDFDDAVPADADADHHDQPLAERPPQRLAHQRLGPRVAGAQSERQLHRLHADRGVDERPDDGERALPQPSLAVVLPSENRSGDLPARSR